MQGISVVQGNSPGGGGGGGPDMLAEQCCHNSFLSLLPQGGERIATRIYMQIICWSSSFWSTAKLNEADKEIRNMIKSQSGFKEMV
jgi:hypothetical protein